MGSIAAKRIDLAEHVAGKTLACIGGNKRRNSFLNDLLGNLGNGLCGHAERVACTPDIGESPLLLDQGLHHVERCGPIERGHSFPLPTGDMRLDSWEPDGRGGYANDCRCHVQGVGDSAR